MSWKGDSMSAPIATVRAWHEAVNAGDVERAVALADADVEMGGPRGTVRGLATLREWVEQSGIQLQPRRIFARDERIVVEQVATWRVPATAELTARDTVASAFVVRDGLIHSIVRYPDLASALASANLSQDDEYSSS